MSVSAELTINRNIILGHPSRQHSLLWVISAALASCSALATAYFVAFPRHSPLRQDPPRPIVVKKIAVAPQRAQPLVTNHPAPTRLPVIQVKAPVIKTVTASETPPKTKQAEAPAPKPMTKTALAVKPQNTAKAKADPCSASLAGKTSASMSGLSVRSILPDTLIYGADGTTCTLRPGSALGTDERVTGVDAELLRIHTTKRTIQLIDK